MADRVAVFNDGKIVQHGTPQEIYQRPKTRFVADFVGSSNVLSPDFSARYFDTKSWASLRPESIRLDPQGKMSALVMSTSFLGSANRITADVEGTKLVVMAPVGTEVPAVGSRITLSWSPADVHTMDDAT